jgi:hypothetical protein
MNGPLVMLLVEQVNERDTVLAGNPNLGGMIVLAMKSKLKNAGEQQRSAQVNLVQVRLC